MRGTEPTGHDRERQEEELRARVEAARMRYLDAAAEYKRILALANDVVSTPDGSRALVEAERISRAAAQELAEVLRPFIEMLNFESGV